MAAFVIPPNKIVTNNYNLHMHDNINFIRNAYHNLFFNNLSLKKENIIVLIVNFFIYTAQGFCLGWLEGEF